MDPSVIKVYMMVIDTDRPAYGTGIVDKIDDDIVYVWYEEVQIEIGYLDDELKFLREI